MADNSELVNALSGGGLLNAIAHPATVNYLDTQRSAAATAAGIWAIRRNQADQATGQAYQAATDPTTGQVDPGKAQALIAQNPAAALAAQPTATSGQALATANASFNQQQQAAIGRQFGSVLALPDDKQTPATYKAALDYTLAHHGITQDHYNAALSNLQAAGSDPAAMRRYGTRLLVGTLAGPEMAATVMPANQDVNTGATVQPMVRQPPVLGGALSPAPGAVPLTTSPATQADLVQITEPDGSKRLVPRSNLPNASGQPNGATPGSGPGAGAQPNTTVGLPLGTSENIAADVAKFKQDQFDIPAGQQRVQSLQKAQIALEAANTGRGSQGVHNMLAVMQTLGIPTIGLADNVASYDTAYKYLTDYARKNGAAAHSDLQLQTSEGANASTGISNQAALDVVHTNIGRERQAIAQNLMAPATGLGYGPHAAKFAKDTDPRGFAIDAYKPADLNPDDPKSIVGRMTPAERAKFYKSVSIANRLGLLNPVMP